MVRLSEGDEARHLVAFGVGGTACCVAVDRVMTVLGVAGDGGVDDETDPWYAGEIAIADERIRVVDLARVIGSTTDAPARSDARQVIVFDATDERGLLYGWLVDSVEGTTAASADALERVGSGGFVTGRLEHEGTTLTWLDERAING